MKLFITTAAVATVAVRATTTTAGTSSGDEKPNLIMLFVDDLGYGDVGFNGHPTTKTPNIDKLAHEGKILSTWYSGCPVCSGSRAALMTGRQYTRTGVPGVFGPTVGNGLPLTEVTLANQMKKAGYRTGAMGKWHLGQRPMFLPAARGFDEYLGIPYSDDMGQARRTACGNYTEFVDEFDTVHKDPEGWMWRAYAEMGYLQPGEAPASANNDMLPLVYQRGNDTTVVGQPLDFTKLALHYQNYTDNFLKESAEANDPFFLYMPFSHVHTTANNQPEEQYAGCTWQNSTTRGPFGDALAEVDWQVGELVASLEKYNLRDNTMIVFSADNGPWMVKEESGGSPGIFTGRYSGYWNTGKGSTWGGGIREAAFVNWPGKVTPHTRTSETVSSLDVLPTFSKIAGVDLPEGVTYDGKDVSDVFFNDEGVTPHEFLFFYGGAGNCGNRKCANCNTTKGPTAVRWKNYKAHYGTGPGLGGCVGCKNECYPDVPLLFDVERDPAEAYPLTVNNTMPSDPELQEVVKTINAAFDHEQETFTWGELVTPPALPDEEEGQWAICCDALPYGGSKPVKDATCDCNGAPYPN